MNTEGTATGVPRDEWKAGLQAWLRRNGACREGRKWAERFCLLQTAIRQCERHDWLAWLASRLGGSERARHQIEFFYTIEEARTAVLYLYHRQQMMQTGRKLREINRRICDR